MQSFAYKVKKNERFLKGTITSFNRESAEELLTKTGCEIIYLKKQFFTLEIDNKLSKKELISFFSSMASMDKVGIDVLHALELMKNEVAGSLTLKQICEKIYFSVAGGMPLSQACEKASKSFTHDFVGLIAVAEKTGKYASTFEEIVAYIKWDYDVKLRAKKAVRGPLATLAFVVAIILGLSTVLLPKITDFIKYFGMETPLYTRMLMSFSEFIRNEWYVALLTFIFLFISIKSLKFLSTNFAIKFDKFKLKIPLFGQMILKIDTSRFITFFSVMYKNGADIVEIMNSISKIVANKYLGHRIEVMSKKIEDGETIFNAIEKEKVFPQMFRKMIAICEATGEVGPILENVRYFYDTEVKDTTEKVVGMLKPITTIFLGIVVAWMGMAMMGPIYANIGQISDITANSKSY